MAISTTEKWIVLLTDPRADFGQYRVMALSKSGKLTSSLDRAKVFDTQDEAKAAIRNHGGSWRATVAPFLSPAIPALPWEAKP